MFCYYSVLPEVPVGIDAVGAAVSISAGLYTQIFQDGVFQTRVGDDMAVEIEKENLTGAWGGLG